MSFLYILATSGLGVGLLVVPLGMLGAVQVLGALALWAGERSGRVGRPREVADLEREGWSALALAIGIGLAVALVGALL